MKTVNTFHKFCPNVYVAKCEMQHERCEIIVLTTKYGKEVECEVHNHLGQTKDGQNLYSITRVDGFNSQERAARKAEKLEGYAANAEKRSNDYYQASKEGAAFLSLGEPIKIGHHSERRHRRLIERNWERMGKSVAESERAKDYERRAEYWADKANKIDLSMPESLSYFEFELEKAKKYHLLLKENPEKRAHSMSLQYANKAVRDMEEKVFLALRLWGDEEDIKQMQEQRQEKAQGKAAKSQKKQDIIERHHGFFSFNNEQFYEGYNKLKANGILNEGEKVVHVGMGLYIPKTQVESFLTEYKRG